jgi:uncharacterized membrane protein YfcA
MTTTELVLALAAVAVGGIVKGAVGAGAPVVAIPILSLLFNVPFAVAVMSFPNLWSNIFQGWASRAHLLHRRFVLSFAISGAAGAVVGTLFLAWLPERPLTLILAAILVAYLGFRFLRPDWKISDEKANRIVIPVGAIGGMLQGAAGLSAPVSVTFLNAMKLERKTFIATISIFFMAVSLVQVPALWKMGIMGQNEFRLSLMALVPLLGGMPIGAWAARHVSRETFDKLILSLLTLVAIRLLWVGITGA